MASRKIHSDLYAGRLGAYDLLKYGIPKWAKKEAAYLGGRMLQELHDLLFGKGKRKDNCR
jgi:hypothetical protein